MKKLLFLVVFTAPFLLNAQHTFSIVAVDSITGEIGSAGATCGDSIIWPGTPGAYIISDVLPGIGAIHTQSYHHNTNQANARLRMEAGDSPDEIISWLEANDVAGEPEIRQYGVVDFNGGSPRSAGYTGVSCFAYKNHVLGPNYAIQGNILLGQEILDSMEARFNREEGCLSDKLMASMQGANVVGADTRCTSEGTSSLSAFLRVAKPDDTDDDIFIDINVAGTADGVEPIDELQGKYDAWKAANDHDCGFSEIETIENDETEYKVFPNPVNGELTIALYSDQISEVMITDLIGNVIFRTQLVSNETIQIATENWSNGLYSLVFFQADGATLSEKVLVAND